MLVIQFQVLADENAVATETHPLAVRPGAVLGIEGSHDERVTPRLHLAGGASFALAESWAHAVEKWEDALADQLVNLDDFDDDDDDDDALDDLDDDEGGVL